MPNPSSLSKNGRVFRVEMPCELTYVKSMRRFLVSVLRLAGVPEEHRDSLALVFTELCNNSIEHGCAIQRETRGIHIELALVQGQIVLSIRDPGSGPSTAADLKRALDEAQNAPEVGNERGMGLFLVRSIMDEVEVMDEGERGTVMKAVKRWSNEV